MASPSSDVDICNLALQRLGADPISALNEDSVEGRECNRVYDHAKDSELRGYRWNFARARVSIAASATAPAFEFANAFQLPVDFLRINPDNTVTDWQIEGRQIFTNDDAPLQLKYFKIVNDPNDFDELFIELLVSRIALDIVEKITQSNTKTETAQKRYNAARREARRVNSFENTSQSLPEDPWLKARL